MKGVGRPAGWPGPRLRPAAPDRGRPDGGRGSGPPPAPGRACRPACSGGTPRRRRSRRSPGRSRPGTRSRAPAAPRRPGRPPRSPCPAPPPPRARRAARSAAGVITSVVHRAPWASPGPIRRCCAAAGGVVDHPGGQDQRADRRLVVDGAADADDDHLGRRHGVEQPPGPAGGQAGAHAGDDRDHRPPVEGAGPGRGPADPGGAQPQTLGERSQLQGHGAHEGDGWVGRRRHRGHRAGRGRP